MAQDRVFDASALTTFLRNEPGADKVEDMIVEAKEQGTALLVTSVNLGEVWYVVARYRNDADMAISSLMNLGLLHVDVTWSIAREAASLRVKYKLPYGDCCAAALAKINRMPLVTCDYDFKAFEREVKIQWVKGHHT